MRSLLPGVLLPLVGSERRRPHLSPWVVLSSRISVWTPDRYTSHPRGVGRGQKHTTDSGGTDPVQKGLDVPVALHFVRLYGHVLSSILFIEPNLSTVLFQLALDFFFFK